MSIESIPEECRADVLQAAKSEGYEAFSAACKRGEVNPEIAAARAHDAVIARYAALADKAAAASRTETAAMDPDQPEPTLKGENDRLRFAVARLTKDNAALQKRIGALRTAHMAIRDGAIACRLTSAQALSRDDTLENATK